MRTAKRRRRPVLCQVAVFFIAAAGAALAASVSDLDLALAREEALVTDAQGRTFRGRLDGLREGRLYISTATDGGEVGYSFTQDDIRELVLPGESMAAEAVELFERGELEAALPLLTALARQRLRYLPVLDHRQRQPLVAYVQALEASGDHGRAVGTTGLLLPYATERREQTILRDTRLRGNLALGFADEARLLAREWCGEADPSGTSALGWRILAQVEYAAGDFEKALWTALQPVAFSSFLPMEYLDECYALAIASAHRLDDTGQAMALWREMSQRGIRWPDDPALNPVRAHYAALAEAETAATAPEDDLVPGRALRPADDRRLPLREVRKIITPPGS